jgi:hypothetical protein
MANKIKIEKADIEANQVELPDGYVFQKVKTKAERRAEIQERIDIIDEMIEPSEEALLDEARVNHPYYFNQEIRKEFVKQLEQLG